MQALIKMSERALSLPEKESPSDLSEYSVRELLLTEKTAANEISLHSPQKLREVSKISESASFYVYWILIILFYASEQAVATVISHQFPNLDPETAGSIPAIMLLVSGTIGLYSLLQIIFEKYESSDDGSIDAFISGIYIYSVCNFGPSGMDLLEIFQSPTSNLIFYWQYTTFIITTIPFLLINRLLAKYIKIRHINILFALLWNVGVLYTIHYALVKFDML